ncbi:hypothetical protein OG205_20385 [Lentzea sp. NBC_00516]|uniref:hypothetical protein n=1 Tax=Lentzea sp. NBC_00516 TaxID=2903582 RepID=UPI002E814FAE|nr:hypothetical protein [Lentzea sp. NBC_00516]WUD29278.1 hypothetical protein OG205_20385 [Lentzea sp. NBC_00516]
MEPVVLESLPDEVVASLEIRDAWRRKLSESGEGLEFIVSDLTRWPLGEAVRVAFLDGDKSLHQDIAEATKQITDSCNLTLDFGLTDGEYRRWTESDTSYAAEIRVSFDQRGYFSLVGTDSTDRTVGAPGLPVGGRPDQRSLNLGGFTTSRPTKWEGTVRHEFMHALGFHHAHQNMRGPCAAEFRWDDDSGYQPTRDPRGTYVPDTAGRRPGVYTYLAGAPNFWSRAKVDHNLRTDNDPELVLGPFDRASVMLYVFADFFYKNAPSPCSPTGNGIDLSPVDKRGLRLLYPQTARQLADRANQSLSAMGAGNEAAVDSTDYQARVIELLTGMAGVRA